MTVAKQGQIICDLLDRGLISAIVSTGAVLAHGLTESIGLIHYRYDSSQSDATLFAHGYNRVYDTLEMETNLNQVQRFVAHVLESEKPPAGGWCSSQLCAVLGRHLDQRDEGPGILRSAYQQGVPVFIPAFTDSEMGLDFAISAMLPVVKAARESRRPLDEMTAEELFTGVPAFNPFLDLQGFARLASSVPRLGIFTIGGGVPRNWAQQVAPYVEVTNHQLGTQLRVPRFQYGVRICPEPVHWGGLSGCTYSEGVAWGKFVPTEKGGRYAEVYADATTVLPLLVKALFESLDEAADAGRGGGL